MTPEELELAVFELEDIRVVVRAPRGTQLGDYQYARKAAGGAKLAHWLGQRIIPLLDGHEFTVVDGSGTRPHGQTKLSTVRASYTG